VDSSVLLSKHLRLKFKMENFKKREKFIKEFFKQEPAKVTKRRAAINEARRQAEIEEAERERQEALREELGVYYRDPTLPREKGAEEKEYLDEETNTWKKKHYMEDPDDYETSPDFEDEDLTDEQKIERFTFNLRRILIGEFKTQRRYLWWGIFYYTLQYVIYALEGIPLF